jgi:hypothetical protein
LRTVQADIKECHKVLLNERGDAESNSIRNSQLTSDLDQDEDTTSIATTVTTASNRDNKHYLKDNYEKAKRERQMEQEQTELEKKRLQEILDICMEFQQQEKVKTPPSPLFKSVEKVEKVLNDQNRPLCEHEKMKKNQLTPSSSSSSSTSTSTSTSIDVNKDGHLSFNNAAFHRIQQNNITIKHLQNSNSINSLVLSPLSSVIKSSSNNDVSFYSILFKI